MTDVLNSRTFDLKWFGTLTPKQILGLISAFALALILTLFGFGSQCMCLGMVLIAAVLCMLPRLLGVDNLKLMSVFGVLFLIAATLIGGIVMAPKVVDGLSGDPMHPDDKYPFTEVKYTYEDNTVYINADIIGEIGTHDVYLRYGEVVGISYGTANVDINNEIKLNVIPDTEGNWKVSGQIDLNRDKLYGGYLLMTTTNDGEEVIVDNNVYQSKYGVLFSDVYEGDVLSLGLYGCFIFAIYILIIYFAILFMSSFMRKRMEQTREQMEKEGRLYPPGYGRCENCGTVVLPGEINCRKCGAYIDRPEEMKPQKKDYFECSDCGAEVPADANECPKCGAHFDEDETEIIHSDETVEIIHDKVEREDTYAKVLSDNIQCPECGGIVPEKVEFCPRCGAKFKKTWRK